MTDPTSGLLCPRCGGMVPIPEGMAIVICPFCELRSVIKGERGIRRYQLPCRIKRKEAAQAMSRFLSSNLAIARGAAKQARLNEAFTAYLPFWMVWSRAIGYALGEERHGSGNDVHYEPKEVRIVQEMTWNEAACDVGEFGVNQVPLAEQPLEPFTADALHSQGLVFEPVSAPARARAGANLEIRQRLEALPGLDRVSQFIVRTIGQKLGLVYYPLWIMRYEINNRTFQVTVDGYDGRILYGKAPGNILYRSAVLVGGMALGAFLAIDVSTLLLTLLGNSDDSPEGLLLAVLAVFVGGLGIMWSAYKKFRYGEHYEYRFGTAKRLKTQGGMQPELANPERLVENLLGKMK